jgi:hypothetical protein
MITLPDYRHPTRRAVLSGPAIAIASLVFTRNLSHAELGPQFVTRHGQEARFHDYTSLTAHDVVFSINILKQKGNPTVSQSLQGIQLIQAKNDHEVVVILASRLNRELPLTIASQPIFSAS